MSQAAITLSPKTPKDLKLFSKDLGIFARQQPFAMSKAINDTAFDVRRASITEYGRSFQIRNKAFIRSALRVKKSTKRNLQAHVWDRFNKDWLARQVTGGVKKARSKQLLIPIQAKQTGRGTKNPRSYKNTFVDKSKSGKPGLYQRWGRGGKKVRLLFTMQPQVAITKGFKFFERANRATRRLFDGHFDTAWRYTKRTARL